MNRHKFEDLWSDGRPTASAKDLFRQANCITAADERGNYICVHGHQAGGPSLIVETRSDNQLTRLIQQVGLVKGTDPAVERVGRVIAEFICCGRPIPDAQLYRLFDQLRLSRRVVLTVFIGDSGFQEVGILTMESFLAMTRSTEPPPRQQDLHLGVIHRAGSYIRPIWEPSAAT